MPIAAAYIAAAGGYKIADSDPTEAASQGRRGDDFFFPVEQICISMYLNGEQGPGELSSAAIRENQREVTSPFQTRENFVLSQMTQNVLIIGYSLWLVMQPAGT